MLSTPRVSKFLLVMLVVVLVEAAAIATLHSLEERSARSAIRYGQLSTEANRLDALEWRAMARRCLESDVHGQMLRLRADMDRNMEESRPWLPRDPTESGLRQTYTEYKRAVDKQIAHLQRGELDRAKWHDDHQVDPAFERLDAALLAGRNASLSRAGKFSQLALWGTSVALAVSTGLILILLALALMSQRRAVRASFDRRLLEESERAAAEVFRLNQGLEDRVAERTSQLERAKQSLEAEVDRRRRLENLVHQIADQEQVRLGQDLHDGLGQVLTGAAMLGSSLEGRLRSRGLAEAQEVGKLTRLVAEALQATRNLAWQLYPAELDGQGLVASLHALALRLQTESGVECVCSGPDDFAGLEHDKAVTICRIAQEAARNAIRHGKPTKVLIALRSAADRVSLVVENDGPILQPTAGAFDGLGCRIMKSRANVLSGALTIEALATGGCRVTCTCRLPLEPRT